MMMSSLSEQTKDRIAVGMLFISPACFCTNMLLARAMAGIFPPVSMAVVRWLFVAILIGIWCAPAIWQYRRQLRDEWLSLAVLGGLGMGLCGAPIYLAGTMTTATNIGLIYTACPILVLVISFFIGEKQMGAVQIAGICAGCIGVITILVEGSFSHLVSLSFNHGDLLVGMGTIAFAFYSVGLGYVKTGLPPLVRFGAMAFFGAMWHMPFLVYEAGIQQQIVSPSWMIGGVVILLVFVSSLGAYLSYGLIVSRLGAGRAAIVLYISPLYNMIFAILLLSETVQLYQAIGTALILGGLYASQQAVAATVTGRTG